jgi:hypothetical protein
MSQVGHQVDGALFESERIRVMRHVVFEADADVVRFDAFDGTLVAEVEAGFDGHDPAGGEGFGGETDVMDVESEGVAEAVHEVLLHRAFHGVLGRFAEIGGFEQAEVDAFPGQQFLGGLLPVLGFGTPGFRPAMDARRARRTAFVDLPLAFG